MLPIQDGNDGQEHQHSDGDVASFRLPWMEHRYAAPPTVKYSPVLCTALYCVPVRQPFHLEYPISSIIKRDVSISKLRFLVAGSHDPPRYLGGSHWRDPQRSLMGNNGVPRWATVSARTSRMRRVPLRKYRLPSATPAIVLFLDWA